MVGIGGVKTQGPSPPAAIIIIIIECFPDDEAMEGGECNNVSAEAVASGGGGRLPVSHREVVEAEVETGGGFVCRSPRLEGIRGEP